MSIENLPPRLNKSNQYQQLFELTLGQNPNNSNNGPSFYVRKRKSRLKWLLPHKIINAVHFPSLAWNKLIGAVRFNSKLYTYGV